MQRLLSNLFNNLRSLNLFNSGVSNSLLAAVLLSSLLAAFGLLALAALTFAFSRFLAATHSANGYKRDKQYFFHNTK